MNKKNVLLIKENEKCCADLIHQLQKSGLIIETCTYSYFLHHKGVLNFLPDLIFFPLEVLDGHFSLVSCILHVRYVFPEKPVLVFAPLEAEHVRNFFGVLGAVYYAQETVSLDELIHIMKYQQELKPLPVDMDIELFCLREITRILAGRFVEVGREVAAQLNQDHAIERDAVFVRLNQMLSAKDEQLVQAEKLAVMGTLVAGLAHEIKNPLTAINGFWSVLKKHILPSDNYRINTALDGIKLGIDHLTELVNNFVVFSRRTGEEFVEADIRDIVVKALSLSSPKLKEQCLSWELILAEDLPRIPAIPGQLVQVFLNLILNSIHAMKSGGKLTIEGHLDPSTKYIEIRITDTGHGIAPENLPKIFDVFFTTRDNTQGAGLGLSITCGIIEKHKGFIDVRSELNRGTTFILKLPTV